MSIASTSARLARPIWRKRALAIPIAVACTLTASASGLTLIHVHSGDTLSEIAARYHTSVSRLVALNDLPGDGDLIYAGQTLRVPGHASGSATRTYRRTVFHTVVRGDTVWGIARHYHVDATRLARRNHLPSSLTVVLGQRLVIRHRTVTSHAAAPTSGETSLSAAAAHDRSYLAQRSEPSSSEIESMIRSTAARWGVDPRLALAIAWQESGWNMRAVSPVDAVGTMQIMRYTGSYLSADVVHRGLDLYDAQDNITAGVALLALLTHEASSTSQAVAGYYQGLQSVRDHGMYSSTQQYVADVMALRERY